MKKHIIKLNKLIFFIVLFPHLVIAQDYKLLEICADNLFEYERSRQETRWNEELSYSEKCSKWLFKSKNCVRSPYNKDYTKEMFEYWSTIKNKPLSKKLKNAAYPNYYDQCFFDYKNNSYTFEQNLKLNKWWK